MSKVFVVDTNKRPLEPIHPEGARLLLTKGHAAVYRKYPFTIILHRKIETPRPARLQLKIDPGARTTGFALVNDQTGEIVWAAGLSHRGAQIKEANDQHRSVRRVFPLLILAKGYGTRQMCKTNYIGFPVSHRKRRKRYFGYQTGDRVRAVVPESYVCRGTHVGRVAVKAGGYFTIATAHGKVTDVPHRYCQPIQRDDGYDYRYGTSVPRPSISPKRMPASSPT